MSFAIGVKEVEKNRRGLPVRQRRKKKDPAARKEAEFWASLAPLNEAASAELEHIDVDDGKPQIFAPLVGTTVINAFDLKKPTEEPSRAAQEEERPAKAEAASSPPQKKAEEDDPWTPLNREDDDSDSGELTYAQFPKNTAEGVPEELVSLFREFPVTDAAFGDSILDLSDDAILNWKHACEEAPYVSENSAIQRGLAEAAAKQQDPEKLMKFVDEIDQSWVPRDVDPANPEHDEFTKLGKRFVQEMKDEGTFPAGNEEDDARWRDLVKKNLDAKRKEHEGRPFDIERELDDLRRDGKLPPEGTQSVHDLFEEEESASSGQERDAFYAAQGSAMADFFKKLDAIEDASEAPRDFLRQHFHATPQFPKDPHQDTIFDLDKGGVPETKSDDDPGA